MHAHTKKSQNQILILELYYIGIHMHIYALRQCADYARVMQVQVRCV